MKPTDYIESESIWFTPPSWTYTWHHATKKDVQQSQTSYATSKRNILNIILNVERLSVSWSQTRSWFYKISTKVSACYSRLKTQETTIKPVVWEQSPLYNRDEFFKRDLLCSLFHSFFRSQWIVLDLFWSK